LTAEVDNAVGLHAGRRRQVGVAAEGRNIDARGLSRLEDRPALLHLDFDIIDDQLDRGHW
jgi:hypothetical protein